jgi:hypothetical protein
VDIAAHLGGLAGGVLCGLAIALPITPEGFARRSRTNALVLAGGLLVVLGMIAALPKGRGLSAGLDKAGKREAQALAAFSSAAALAQQGRLSNAQFADAIQNQVVYGLRESRASLCRTAWGRHWRSRSRKPRRAPYRPNIAPEAPTDTTSGFHRMEARLPQTPAKR